MKYFFLTILIFFSVSSFALADGNNVTVGNLNSSSITATEKQSDSSVALEGNPTTLDFFLENDFLSTYGRNLIWAFFGALLGSMIAFMAEKYREPRLSIIAEESANSDNIYPSGHDHAGQRWKFFRVKVKNEPQLKILSKLISRSTAQQVNARIRIIKLNQAFKGRWASTLELVNASPLDINRIVNFPDPITLIAGYGEYLDVFTKYENDAEAYGWNNEAYLYNWRTPFYKMNPGNYEIEIQVVALSGAQVKKTFKVHIANTIEKTYIKEPT